jgi:hypothetical protein
MRALVHVNYIAPMRYEHALRSSSVLCDDILLCVLRVLRVACCLLLVACCLLRVACCVLRVACCVLRVACCVLRVACCEYVSCCVVHCCVFVTLRCLWKRKQLYEIYLGNTSTWSNSHSTQLNCLCFFCWVRFLRFLFRAALIKHNGGLS